MFASWFRRRRVHQLLALLHCQRHVDGIVVKTNSDNSYLWRAVDPKGEVLKSVVTKRRNKSAAREKVQKIDGALWSARNFGHG